MLLFRRTCSVVLMLALLLAWADADTPSLALTRFALTVAAIAGLGMTFSYVVRPRGLPPVTTAGQPDERTPAEQQLAFSFSDDS